MKYDVLKNCNLAENGFSLSLTRGETRSDLESNFSKPYIKWHCDEKFLKVSNSVTEEPEIEEDGLKEPEIKEDEIKEPEIKEDEPGIKDTLIDEPEVEAEDFPDFDSMSLADIKSYAKDHNVDIAGLKKKVDIIDTILDDLAEEE